MRTAAATVFGLVLAIPAFAADGALSNQVLAQMGLSDLQFMSDSDAASVRGMGFYGFEGARLYKDGLRNYHKQVKEFHKTVKKFERKLLKPHHRKPDGMKPPKMDLRPKVTKMPKMRHGPKIW